ncbi:hypothetical protein DBR43_31615 [Pedobacter sp. KBW06]|uniref:IPT/TIG domain-containing protein n=1 Tax=Pedobacter sp. KBW06 TaxID=2153359 RepID=UPI000F5ACE29|nr:IPT/TIG domain-containing protein [Pedobacter sp. KBW06]RQO64830.1 hypothetical protein DBR43_31615 [Pedobacter sp. KBW06]
MNLAIIKNSKNCLYGLAIALLLVAGCKKDKIEPVKEAVTVSEYYPNSGNKGTLITILGTGFGNSMGEVSASIGGVNAELVSVTPTAVVMRAPSAAKDGEIVMKIGETSFQIGKYTYQELSVQKITPANGGEGTLIRISGAGFSSLSGPAQVFINGKAANVVSAKDTLLVIQVPAGATSGPVKVVVNGKEASGQSFRFQAIADIHPLTGGKGTRVRINGSGFEAVVTGNYVDFNGKAALVEEAADDHLMVVAPDGITTGPVSVTMLGQKITGPVFTVVPLPVILNVTPLSGPAGTLMTIKGTTFSTVIEENKVSINGVNVPVATATDTEITLEIPGGTGSGKIVLSVNDQRAMGPDFKDQTLGISRLSPENGLAGTRVNITGTGFSATASQNQVTFNGTAATVLSATESSMVVIAPQGFTSGPLKLVVNGQTALAPGNFNRAGVATLAGGPGSTELNLSRDQNGSLVVDSKGNVFVLETENHRVMKITPDGKVSLLAGSASGDSGNADGQGNKASFSLGRTGGMSIDDQDNLFITDGKGVRKVTPQGLVSTFSAIEGNKQKSAFDKNGNLYVQIGSFDGAWKINKMGLKTMSKVSGSGFGEDVTPVIVGDMFYTSDYESAAVQTYNLETGASGFLANGFSTISGMVADGAGSLYVVDRWGYTLRKINLATKEVTIIATFASGSIVDGALSEARFGGLGDITIDKQGNLYVIDMTNNSVRKIFLK